MTTYAISTPHLILLQTVCGISVVQHYERFKRFNVVQVGEMARRDNELLKENTTVDGPEVSEGVS